MVKAQGLHKQALDLAVLNNALDWGTPESQFRDDRSVLESLTANYTYLNERLARHYGVSDVYGSRFRRVALPNDPHRAGFLSQGSLLTVTSYPNRTSPVLRGKWVLNNLLGAPPPPPPPDVPGLPDRGERGKPASVRERLEQHRNRSGCRRPAARPGPSARRHRAGTRSV